MVHAVICSLAVIALSHIAVSSASGSCPTLFNFYSHPTDCTKFYRCFWGSPVEFSCPAGTHWNQQILTCDHAYNVPCATAILNPIYKLVKDDGYGYQKVGYVNYDGSKGYEKGNYGYETSKGYEKGNYGYVTSKGYDKGNYGYVTNKGYDKGNYGYVTSKGYDKGSYGYDSSKGDNKMYGGSYVRSNDYGNYGNYWGTAGYTKQTYPPSVGHNYGGFAARAGYANYNNGYARPQYVTNGYVKPNYGGYSAGGYGSRAASGYARVGDPIVGRVFGKASYATKKYGGWKK